MSVMRKEHHLTQVELADLVGLHRAYIGFIEQGRRNPSIANVKRICDALGVSLSTIFSPFDKSPRKPRLRTL
jgi:transcriptional regulator with XRE-family HTH domain